MVVTMIKRIVIFLFINIFVLYPACAVDPSTFWNGLSQVSLSSLLSHEESVLPEYISLEEMIRFHDLLDAHSIICQGKSPEKCVKVIKAPFLKDKNYRKGVFYRYIHKNLCFLLRGQLNDVALLMDVEWGKYDEITQFIDDLVALTNKGAPERERGKEMRKDVESTARLEMLLLREAKFFQLWRYVLLIDQGTLFKTSSTSPKPERKRAKKQSALKKYISDRARFYDSMFALLPKDLMKIQERSVQETFTDYPAFLKAIHTQVRLEMFDPDREFDQEIIDDKFVKKIIYQAVQSSINDFYQGIWRKYFEAFQAEIAYQMFIMDFGIQQYIKNVVLDGNEDFRNFVEQLRGDQRQAEKIHIDHKKLFLEWYEGYTKIQEYFKTSFLEKKFREILLSILTSHAPLWMNRINLQSLWQEEKRFFEHIAQIQRVVLILVDINDCEVVELWVPEKNYISVGKSKKWIEEKMKELSQAYLGKSCQDLHKTIREDLDLSILTIGHYFLVFYLQIKNNYWQELIKSDGYVSNIKKRGKKRGKGKEKNT